MTSYFPPTEAPLSEVTAATGMNRDDNETR